MSASDSPPRFVTDPHAVVKEIVANADPQLDCTVVDQVVMGITLHKPRIRRLAQALQADPELLTSGRAEGPRMVAQLIGALLAAGSTRVVLPRCAHCGKQSNLTSLAADTGHRICGWCAIKQREQVCGRCGRKTAVAYRDRRGTPRCQKCPPVDGDDPVTMIVRLLRSLGTGLSVDTLTTLVTGSVPQPTQRQRLAWELEDNPSLLTGQGAQGSPRLQALLEVLVEHGARVVVLPACPCCGEHRPAKYRRDGLRCCRYCYEQARTEPCSHCGVTKRIATRTAQGQAVCHVCSRRDPLNFQRCTSCGTQATPVVNNSTETLCRGCYRPPMAICSICGRHRPCYRAHTDAPYCWSCTHHLRAPEQCVHCGRSSTVVARTPDGGALCGRCHRRPEEVCILCGRTRRVNGRIPEGPLCRPCYGKHPVSLHACERCGTVERLYHHGLCTHCAANRQLHDLLSDTDPVLQPAGQAVLDTLITSNPLNILLWLRDPTPRRMLIAIGHSSEPLSHTLLDNSGPSRAVTRLRAALVAHGALPDRDEQLAALERWLTPYLEAQVSDLAERRAVHRFFTWHCLRRLRRRGQRAPAGQVTLNQALVVKREIRVACHLIRQLRANGSCLTDCNQSDVDQWLAAGSTYRYEARTFILWAVRRGHASAITIPSRPQQNPRAHFIDADDRWALARRLLHDTTLDTVDRVAGLLLLLHAQPLSHIARLTLDRVTQRVTDRTVQLHLGRKPLELPAPLDHLVLDLVDRRHGRAVVGRTHDLTWLLPGGAPGHPISARQLMRRLQKLDIRARHARNTTLMDLAAQLPASVLADLLGLRTTTATRWAQLAGNTRPTYAAEVAHRKT